MSIPKIELILFVISVSIGLLNNSSLYLVLPLCGLVNLQDIFEAVLFFKAFIDIAPCTGYFIGSYGVELAFAVGYAAAGTVKKAFGTPGHGTYAAGIADNAYSAGTASFFIYPYISVYSDGYRVYRRKNGYIGEVFGKKLGSGPACHGDHAVIIGYDLFKFNKISEIACSFHSIAVQPGPQMFSLKG